MQLFDEVLGRLVEEIEAKARAEFASRWRRSATRRSGWCGGSPRTTTSPLQARCCSNRPAARSDLVAIARTKSQAHLLAISSRPGIAEPVTDVLVRRGDQAVARSVADNQGARLSETAFRRWSAGRNRMECWRKRSACAPTCRRSLFRELLLQATDVVQQRLLASAQPETQAEIQRVLAKVSDEVAAPPPAGFHGGPAQRSRFCGARQAQRGALVRICQDGRYGETGRRLSHLCAVPIEIVDRLMGGDRPDPILILCKSAGFELADRRPSSWRGPAAKSASSQALDAAFSNFERLRPRPPNA